MACPTEFKELNNCRICPRGCGANRSIGKIGLCHENAQVRVSRTSLHKWEEPCISGTEGSGTVFFTGCSLGCVYCQNRRISNGENGKPVSVGELADLFLRLQEKYAHNINLVTPTHFVPQIVRALELAKAQGLIIPVVYNTSSYEKVDTLRSLTGLVDIYLPDFKYKSAELSVKYSHAPDYFDVASAAVDEMFRQVGTPVFDSDDEESRLMKRGVIVRHLLLPGCTDDSKDVIKYLYDTFGDDIYMSIMSQFTPLENVEAYPEINRKVMAEEYDEVIDFAAELGVTNAFVQDGNAAMESFIPDFEGGYFI